MLERPPGGSGQTAGLIGLRLELDQSLQGIMTPPSVEAPRGPPGPPAQRPGTAVGSVAVACPHWGKPWGYVGAVHGVVGKGQQLPVGPRRSAWEGWVWCRDLLFSEDARSWSGDEK